MDTLNYQQPSDPSSPKVSTDELSVGGVLQHVQRMKLGLGVRDAYQGDLAFGQAVAASSVPVVISTDQSSLPVTVGNFPDAQQVVGVSGVPTVQFLGTPQFALSNPFVAVTGSLPAGTNALGSVSVSNFPSSQNVAVTNQPTVGLAFGTQVGVSGTPTVQFAAGQSVSVGNFPPVQEVSLNNPAVALTGVVPTHGVTQSGGWSVAVTGSLPAGTNALGSVSVLNFPGTQSVTFPSAQAVNAAQAGGWAVAVTGSLPAGTNPIGSVGFSFGSAVGVTGVPTVSVSNFPAVQQVSVNNPAVALTGVVPTHGVTQSGGWTVAVTGSLPAGTNGIGSVSVSNPVTAVALTGVAQVTQAGTWSVGLAGNPVVGVSGVPTVQFLGTPSFSLGAGAVVGVSGQPTVAVANPVTAVALTGVVPTHGVTQSGGWTVAVTGSLPAGTNGIGSVTVSNQPTVALAPYSQVGVSGVPTVQFLGVPSVSLAGNPVVGVSGVPTVQFLGVPSFSLAGNPVVGVSGQPTVSVANPVTAVAITGVVPSHPVTFATPQSVNAAQSGGWSVAVTGSLPAGANALGTVGVTSLPATVTVSESGVSSTNSAFGTAGLAPAQLSSIAVAKGVLFKAGYSNAGSIFLASTSSVNGSNFEMAAGDAVFLPVSNLNLMWASGSLAGQAWSALGF